MIRNANTDLPTQAVRNTVKRIHSGADHVSWILFGIYLQIFSVEEAKKVSEPWIDPVELV